MFKGRPEPKEPPKYEVGQNLLNGRIISVWNTLKGDWGYTIKLNTGYESIHEDRILS